MWYKSIQMGTVCLGGLDSCPEGMSCPPDPACGTALCDTEHYCCDDPTNPYLGSCPTDGKTKTTPADKIGKTTTPIVQPTSPPRDCGYYYPDDHPDVKTACPGGYYCPVPVESFKKVVPVACDPGFYCPLGSCNQTICDCGYRCPKGTTSMQMCASPFYCPNTGQSDQTECPSGSYCPDHGMCLPKLCPPGTYVGPDSPDKSSCPPCQAGRFCTSAIQSTICPAGSYCPLGSASPKVCDPGYYCPLGSAAQKECPPGLTSSPGATSAAGCVSIARRSLLSVEGEEVAAKAGILSATVEDSAETNAESTTVALVDSAMYASGSFVVLIAAGFFVRRISSRKIVHDTTTDNN